MDIELNVVECRQHYAGRAITGQLCITPIEANLSSIKTQTIQLSTIAMEKLLMSTLINPRHTTATQQVRQCTKKSGWREKEGDVWRKIFGDTKPTTTPPLKLPWTDTGTYTFEFNNSSSSNNEAEGCTENGDTTFNTRTWQPRSKYY